MPDEPIWRYYNYEYPQRDLPIIIEGRDGKEEIVTTADSFNPALNVSGLRWRETGIFREFGGTITKLDCGIQQGSAANSLGFSGLLGQLGSLGATQHFYPDGSASSGYALNSSRGRSDPYTVSDTTSLCSKRRPRYGRAKL